MIIDEVFNAKRCSKRAIIGLGWIPGQALNDEIHSVFSPNIGCPELNPGYMRKLEQSPECVKSFFQDIHVHYCVEPYSGRINRYGFLAGTSNN